MTAEYFSLFAKKVLTNKKTYAKIIRRLKQGPLVKRLRHGPLKAETGVRFSHGSPKQKDIHQGVLFAFSRDSARRIAPHRKQLRSGAEFATLLRPSPWEACKTEQILPHLHHQSRWCFLFLPVTRGANRTSPKSFAPRDGSSSHCSAASVSEAL